jgi:hypothetical protein
MTAKTCGYCGNQLSIDNYHLDLRNQTGYCPICTVCAVYYGGCEHGKTVERLHDDAPRAYQLLPLEDSASPIHAVPLE